MSLTFSKTLAKFYIRWYNDSVESAAYCEAKGWSTKAQGYREDAEQFQKIIFENGEAIEFFSQGDNAHIEDSALPEKWRGYK